METKSISKFVVALLSVCLFVVMCVYGHGTYAGASVGDKKSHKAEYKKFDITVKRNAYYYKGDRIRIFHDRRADCSFVNCFVDRKGTVDVRLTRGESGDIETLELIPGAEAKEILEDLFGYVPTRKKQIAGKNQKQRFKQETAGKKTGKYKSDMGIKRCELDDVPANVQATIKKQCTGKSWYVIETSNKKYVYYNNLPRDYAFNISGKKLSVRDIGRHTGIYVLLSLGKDVQFELSYNAKAVAFTTIQAIKLDEATHK